jgi:hypothetical protein
MPRRGDVDPTQEQQQGWYRLISGRPGKGPIVIERLVTQPEPVPDQHFLCAGSVVVVPGPVVRRFVVVQRENGLKLQAANSDGLPWAKWYQRRCRAAKEPNSSGYWGRCDLVPHESGLAHALGRGMVVLRWSTDWTN